jgi:hypothetical protein
MALSPSAPAIDEDGKIGQHDRMVRGALLEIAGVTYQGTWEIPCVPEAVERFRAAGLSVRFLTNTSRQPSFAMIFSGLCFPRGIP